MTDARFNGVARILKEKMNKSVNDGVFGIGCELAEITANGLKVNGYKDEIQDYLVLENLTLKEDYFTLSDEMLGAEYRHKHKIETPKELKPLAIGDKVLVAVMGAEFVVIGRVVNAKPISSK
ncbi:TPA: hypothetical protein KRE09_003940 [Clostridioides difficile]|uniref:Uncharacterized protein n=2 Tax=Clostridioides difficile TaxID=1496 RepID=A0A9P3YT43_CLODI|nr:hypothetical protein [Clostridioides difficile]EQG78652.1 hypothetical protein QKA_0359 [Clostridioides difficile DA00165]EAA0008373.1 hypothetical protein [Clostridioides difficile]EGT3777079.1 hypothetical protein [Clostridioides difficile]EGT3817983.1 hypothetical protein [Clostridioides difficile]EGT3855847.1 hypothetical protein [Clostridioides difficile]